jgi:hypothetical protein
MAHSEAARVDELYGVNGLEVDLPRPRTTIIEAIFRLPEKGLHDLINAFKAADLDMKLVIAGAANQKRCVFASAVGAGQSQNRIYGHSSSTALHVVLQHASLFALKPCVPRTFPSIAMGSKRNYWL